MERRRRGLEDDVLGRVSLHALTPGAASWRAERTAAGVTDLSNLSKRQVAHVKLQKKVEAPPKHVKERQKKKNPVLTKEKQI